MKAILCLLAALSVAGAARAEGIYPDKRVTVIVPFSPGAPATTTARIVAEGMSKVLGKPFVIENKEGALGAIGVSEVVKATPDGYTVCHCNDGQMTINIAAYLAAGRKPPYVPTQDLVSIGLDAVSYFVLLANDKLPVNNMQELAAYVRARPGKVPIGMGSPSGFLLAGLLKSEGFDLLHVPYKGEDLALQELRGGHIQLLPASTRSALAQSEGGGVKILAAVGAQRNPFFKNVETMGEQGYRAFDEVLLSWAGWFAPRGTSPEVVAVLSQALKKVMQDPAVVDALRRNGNLARYEPPEVAAKRLDEAWPLLKLLWKTGVNLL